MVKYAKIYVFLFSLLVLSRLFFMWDDLPLLLYLAMVLVELLAVVALFGFAFQKYIFVSWFWKIFLFIFFGLESYLLLFKTGIDSTRLIIIFTGIMLPAYVYIFLYAFKNNWYLKETFQAQRKNKKKELQEKNKS